MATVDAARRHLVTAGGEEIPADVIVLAVGLRARTLTGRSQRVITVRTAPDAWTAARVQGERVGRHILEVPDQTRPAPYFSTRQFGRMVQVLGDLPEGSNLEVVAEIPQVAESLYQARCEGVPVGYVEVNAQRFIAKLQVQSGGPAQWTLTGV